MILLESFVARKLTEKYIGSVYMWIVFTQKATIIKEVLRRILC